MPVINTPARRPQQQQGVGERTANLRAIRADDYTISPHADHLASVEQTLGYGLDQMTRPSALVARLERELEDRRRRREPLEREWLDAYRRYNSEYSPEVKARFRAGKSKIWVGMTAMKVHAAHAAIMDFLDKQSWDMEPEAIPKDAQVHPVLEQQGITIEHIKEGMRQRTEDMKTEIESQLEEADFPEHLDQAVLECIITGAGALKGPFTVKDDKDDWEVGFDANMEAVATTVQRDGYRPDSSYVSVFNLYPDMEATNIQDGNGIYEELYLTRAQMMRLAKQPGFDTMAILRVLRDFPTGNANVRPEQVTLRQLAGDADPSSTNRYRVVIYYGPVTGEELGQAGADVPQNMRSLEIQGCVWYCSRYTLKAKRHQGRIPYYIFPYTRRAGYGPFGRGVPMLGKTSQDSINAGARVMLDNAAIASGPVVEANLELLQPGEDPTDLHGWRVFLAKHDGMQQKKAVSIYEIPAYTEQFIKIIQSFRQFMDEETFIPSLTGGMEGTNTTDTATGMSILNSNANRQLKKVMRNIDRHAIEPFIEAHYHWNMRFSPKRNIIAKMRVKAMGYAAVMAREFQSQRMIQLAKVWGAHPDFKSTEALREHVESMDLDEDRFVRSEQEKLGMIAPDQAGGAAGSPPAVAPPARGGGGRESPPGGVL